jgi:hypothetical protein
MVVPVFFIVVMGVANCLYLLPLYIHRTHCTPRWLSIAATQVEFTLEVDPVRNTILSNALVAIMMFLLGAGAAQAQTVIFNTLEPDPAQAIGIDGLVVDGTTYDVDFTARTNPGNTYGDFPGELDFNDIDSAALALAAVDSALNGAPAATTVGQPFNTPQDSYVIGYLAEEDAINGLLYHVTSKFGESWERVDLGAELMPWNAVGVAGKSFARFTVVPEPGTALSTVAALATLGVIRRWRRKESQGTA